MKLAKPRAVGYMVLAALLWSLAGVVTKTLDGAQSLEVTFWRSLFACLSMAVLLAFTQGGVAFFKTVSWRNPALWLSAICWACMFTAFMMALVLTKVANVLLMSATGPLFTAVLARLVTQQRLPRRTWICVAAASAGLAFMFGEAWRLGQRSDIVGCVLGLGVPMAAAGVWTISQKAQQASAINTSKALNLLPSVMLGGGLSALCTLPFALPFNASLEDVTKLAFLGAFQLAMPGYLAILATQALKAAEASLLALLEIIFGISLAWFFVGEVPSDQILLGGALVVAALLLDVGLGLKNERH
jgi:drug/metabolite transporter (DMT)-like permease